jgi:hypothetical protein
MFTSEPFSARLACDTMNTAPTSPSLVIVRFSGGGWLLCTRL